MRKILYIFLFTFFVFSANNLKSQTEWNYNVLNDTIIGWVDMTGASNYGGANCDDCYWELYPSDINSIAGDFTNFKFYEQPLNYLYLTSNGLLGINNNYDVSNYGYILPNSGANRLIQWGGMSNGQIISNVLAKIWQVPNGPKVLTLQLTYQIGLNATDYTADIQIHLIETLDAIEINYTNITGSTGTSAYVGLNNGDGLYASIAGDFPTTPTIYTFTPGMADELSLISLDLQGYSSSCKFTDLVNPTVRLFNKGVDFQSNFNVKLFLNDNLIETYTVTEELAQFDDVEFTFNSDLDFSEDGFYNLKAVIELADYDTTNNTASKSIINFLSAKVAEAKACFGQPATLTATGGDYYIWKDPLYPNNPLYIGSDPFTSPMPIFAAKNFLVSAQSNDLYLTSVANNYTYVDHDATSGDDRAGIAITPNYLYIVGDDATVRMNANNLTGQIDLPIRDGIFSNLADGKLYTLYNTDLSEDINYDDSSFPFTINAIAEMDEDLNITTNIIPLDVPFSVNTNNHEGGVFAGSGIVMIVNGEDSILRKIDITTGVTTTYPKAYNIFDGWNSENWAMWGFIEQIDNIPVSLVYSYNESYFKRMNISTATADIAFALQTDNNSYLPDDLHTITYSPWHRKIYYHSETNGEDGGYFDASAGLGGNCWDTITVEVIQPAWAGYNTTVDACNDDNQLELFPLLIGEANAGGTWVDVNATGAINAGVLDVTELNAGSYEFNYVVAADSPCVGEDQSTLKVNVKQATNAGTATPATVCKNANPLFNLNSTLTDQDLTGYWTDDNTTGVLSGSLINVTNLTLADYNFSYHVAGLGVCIEDVATVVITVDFCSGISNLDNSSLYVYPNPSNGFVSINLDKFNSNKVLIQIVNSQGQIVYNELTNGKNIDLSELSSGIYSIQVIDNDKVYTQKLILK